MSLRGQNPRLKIRYIALSVRPAVIVINFDEETDNGRPPRDQRYYITIT